MSHALCDGLGHAAIEGFGDAAGEWALPGGFLDVEKDKTVAHTAARELKEETGLKLSIKDFKEAGTFSDIKRDPRERVTITTNMTIDVRSCA